MTADKELRIAILGDGFISWTGGIDFLSLCMTGMSSVVEDRTWNILCPTPPLTQRAISTAVAIKRRIFSFFGKAPAISFGVSDTQLQDALTSTGSHINVLHYLESNAGLRRAAKKVGANIIVPCGRTLGRDFPIPWVGYLGDLQHKRLPHLFSSQERVERDLMHGRLLEDAPAVVVNSRAVASDIREFYPSCEAKLFSLPFCPPLNPSAFQDPGEDALLPYNLPEKYFIISNQFWVHKSHETAFAALRLTAEAGYNSVHILCTGNTHDYRHPGHFETLRMNLEAAGLKDRVRFLGVIPKRDQLAIMRRSIAVVQPTLFEGGPGGGSVYDAVSTATPALVSDIAVNREADLGVIEFFRAGSAEDLAQKMKNALEKPPVRLSRDETLSMLRDRQRRMGEALVEALRFARLNYAPSKEHSHGPV